MSLNKMKKLKSIIALAIITLSISCTNSQNFKSVAASEFKAEIIKTNDAQILDVRTAGEYQSGHIKNALQANWNDARLYCFSLKVDGKVGWRLPTIEELEEIRVNVIINTTNIIDSHNDLHLPGLWKKSLQENKFLTTP